MKKNAVYTTETAKLHWCPMASNARHREGTNCLAEHCMAWRWHTSFVSKPGVPDGLLVESHDTYGYCGLAGEP